MFSLKSCQRVALAIPFVALSGYAQAEEENFLIGGDWVVALDVLPFEIENEERRERIESFSVTFTEDTISLPHADEPIAVNYEIDGDHIIVSPADREMDEADYLHYYLREDGLVRADMGGLGIERELPLRRAEAE